MGSKRKPPKKTLSAATAANHVSPNQDKARPPLELQQQLLNIFKVAVPLSQIATLKSTIQKVKGHLYERDFDAAFGQLDHLEAYVFRWSPSRALAYNELFAATEPLAALWHEHAERTCHTKVICIGGGAGAEAVALAGLIRLGILKRASAVVIDRADWSVVLEQLHQRLLSSDMDPLVAHEDAQVPTPTLDTASVRDGTSISTYDSRTPTPTMSSSLAVNSANFDLTFKHQDILSMNEASLRSLLAECTLVTVMFTLNELFSFSLSRTTQLLLTITDLLQPGTMFLVVDSSGSYSEVSLKRDQGAKRYPMDWLLNHTLLEATKSGPGESGKWEKVTDISSRWFRVEPSLEYPMPLENMRYQMHIYRRLGSNAQ